MANLNELIKGKVKYNEDMSRHTTFRIGGVVSEWVEPADVEDLRRVIKFSKAFKKSIYVIGGGSNILVNDKRINGIVISLSSPHFRYIKGNGDGVVAGGGVALNTLLNFCIENGLTGLEFCSGIPGTIGGSVVTNAGLGPKKPLSNVGNFVNGVTIMDQLGRIRTIKKRDLNFGYRTSSIDNAIILEVGLGLKRAKKDHVRKLCKMALERKSKRHDLSRPSAGCIFKNPYGGFISTGKLLELAGLKGKRIGDAKISEKNANYIVNLGNAGFKDVKGLINVMKKSIRKEFNIELELEIKVWG